MSLMSLKRAITRFGMPIVVVLGILILGGVVINGFGATNLGRFEEASPDKAVEDKTIATIGDLKVGKNEFDQAIDGQIQQQRSFGAPAPNAMQKAVLRTQTLEQYKGRAALMSLAQAMGIKPTADDLVRTRDERWQGEKANLAQQLGVKPESSDAEYDAAIAKINPRASVAAIKASFPEPEILLQAYRTALLNKYKSEVKIDAAGVKRTYNEVRVRHILVATGEGKLPEGQAKARAEKILAELTADITKMPALAKQYSDDPGSKNTGGLYEWKAASNYVSEFAQAALDAGVGKLYPQIVPTQYGFHIIKSEGVRPGKDTPKDFDQNAAKYVDEYKTRIAGSKLSEVVQKALPTVKVIVTDPALLAAQLQIEAQTARDKKVRDQKLTQAIAELDKVAKSDDPTGDVPLQKATMYETMEKWPEAAKEYENALSNRNAIETRLSLARLYLSNLKDKAGAAKVLKDAVDLPVPDTETQLRLSQMLKDAGLVAESKVAMDKGILMRKRQEEQMRQQIEAMQKQQGGNFKMPGGAVSVPLQKPDANTKPANKPKPGGG